MKTVVVAFTFFLAFVMTYSSVLAQDVWTRHPSNPMLVRGLAGSADECGVTNPCVIKDGDIYRMWYTGSDCSSLHICYATSSDGINWNKSDSNPVLDSGIPGSWEDGEITEPTVVKDSEGYKMWYTGSKRDGTSSAIGYATSSDGIHWTKYVGNPVLTAGPSGSWDEDGVGEACVIIDSGMYRMWYASATESWSSFHEAIGYATSADGIHWTKYAGNPVLTSGNAGSWDDEDVDNPTVIKNGFIYHLWYEGETGNDDACRIGYATSYDGIGWEKCSSNPVLGPGESGSWDEAEAANPSVVMDGPVYKMWFSSYDGVYDRIGLAQTTNSVSFPDYFPLDHTVHGIKTFEWIYGKEGTYESYVSDSHTVPYATGPIEGTGIVNFWGESQLYATNDGDAVQWLGMTNWEDDPNVMYLSADCELSSPPAGWTFSTVGDNYILYQGLTCFVSSTDFSCEQDDNVQSLLFQIQHVLLPCGQYDNAIIVWYLDHQYPYRRVDFQGKDVELGITFPSSVNTAGYSVTDFDIYAHDIGLVAHGGISAEPGILLDLAVLVEQNLAANCPSADLTDDCRVDLADLRILAEQWIIGGSDDLTGDSLFTFADFAVLASQWKTEFLEPLDMVRIPAGTFQMGDSFSEGSTNERPVHAVTLSSFYMSMYETTNDQYCQFLNSALAQGLITVSGGVVFKAGSGTSYLYCDTSTSSSYSQIAYSNGIFSVRTKGGRSMTNDPMVRVSWYGSVAYCNWRSQQEGLQPCYNLSTWNCDFSRNGYHLPTEAQWEYAARGGRSGNRFPWGNTITHGQANYYSSSSYSYDTSPTRGYHPTWNDGISPYTSPVGNFAPNGYGLHDMAGNVWEWCNDWYGRSYYGSSPQSNPTGPTTGSSCVLRGGGWFGDAIDCRVAFRYGLTPDFRNYIGGFRVCR